MDEAVTHSAVYLATNDGSGKEYGNNATAGDVNYLTVENGKVCIVYTTEDNND